MKEENISVAFEHAWKYFEIHSQQRMIVFNFYVGVIGLLATGSGICLQQGGMFVYFSSALGVFITFITFIFYKLDNRVSFLIKNSESALKILERNLPHPGVRIFSNETNDFCTKKNIFSMWTYGECFRLTFYVLANIGVVVAFIPLFKILVF